jgi:hypothetical protein
MSENPKLNKNAPNNAAADAPSTTNEAKSLTDLYSETYKEVFNKLMKSEQDRVLRDLQKPAQVIRGEEAQYPEVSRFLREVCKQAESKYDGQFAKETKK